MNIYSKILEEKGNYNFLLYEHNYIKCLEKNEWKKVYQNTN